MKVPKGFGKNYFSLLAIQATTSKTTQNALYSRTKALSQIYHDSSQEEEESPPDSLFIPIPITKRCNCIFNQRCRQVLKDTRLRGNPKCNCRHLNHRKTGISPPQLSF